MKRQKNKGITLIALVITIIVLLILAGVVIVTLSGNNSAPQKATEAAQKDAIAGAKDEIAMETQEALLNYYNNKYVSKTSTGASGEAEVQSVVAGAADTAVTNAKSRNKELLETSGVSGNTITLETKSYTVIGTIDTNGGITWGNDGEQQGNTSTVKALAKSGAIKRWDTINYTPVEGASTASIDLPEGTSIEGTKLASVASDLPTGANLEGTIKANDAKNWVVLDVTEDGDVLIMPKTVSDVQLTLTGKDGYNNAIKAINAVAGIYLNPNYALSARSLTLEDVNKVEGNTPNGSDSGPYTWTNRYGMNTTTLDITDEGEGKTASQTYSSIAATDGYDFHYDQFDAYHWLATRCVDVLPSWCNFDVYSLDTGSSCRGSTLLYVHSDGTYGAFSSSNTVIPVITLKSDIQLEKGDPFCTETATATTACKQQTQYVHNAWIINK